MSRLSEQAWRGAPEVVLAMAERLRAAHQQVSETFRRRDESPAAITEWSEATRLFAGAYKDFYEDGTDTRADEVRAGDPSAIELAVRFLVLDPQCFRSGYTKERLLRALKSAALTDPQIDRLRLAMVRAVDTGARRELGEWCRLASRLDVESVNRLLATRLESHDPQVKRRASWVMQRLAQ